MIRYLTLALLCSTLIACGTTRQNVCGKLVPNASAEGDANAMITAGDAAWSARADVAKIRDAITAWNKALAINPKDSATRVKLSRAYYLLADGHLRMDDEKDVEMKETFKKGMREAEIGFALLEPQSRKDFCAKPFTTPSRAPKKTRCRPCTGS